MDHAVKGEVQRHVKWVGYSLVSTLSLNPLPASNLEQFA